MPRTTEQNETMREESRAKIMEAALRLFARHGYERTSIRMIAAEAGIAQGLLYNYFAGKDELLHALFQRSMADVRASFAAAERAADPRTQIEQLIRAAFTVVRDNQDFWRLSYGVRHQPEVLAGLGAELPAWTATIRATLEGYFRTHGADQPAVEAAILFALIDGVSQHYILEPASYQLDAVIETIVARYQVATEKRRHDHRDIVRPRRRSRRRRRS